MSRGSNLGGRYRRACALLAIIMLQSSLFLLAAAPAAAAAPTFGIATSMQNVRPTDSASGRPTSASLRAARNEFESFQIVVQGPATGVSVTGNPFGWSSTSLYRVDYYDALAPSDAEGGTGRWGDVLIPERDAAYGEDRNAFPFNVPGGENRVVWVDVFVPPGTTPGAKAGSLTLTSAGGSANVPIAMEVLDLDLPSTSSLKNAFFMTYNGQDDEICFSHTGSHTCHGDLARRRQLHSLYTRVGLENRVTISNGVGLRGNQGPAAHPAAEWESAFEAPLIRGTSDFPASATFRLDGAQLTKVTGYAYNDYDCLQACANQWEAEATEAGQGFADRVMWYGCDEAGANVARWQACATELAKTRSGWDRPALATGNISQYNAYGAPTGINVSTLVTLINQMHPRALPANGDGIRRDYDPFLAQAGRGLWLYSSCESHGCADDVPGSPGAGLNGWPGYAIDAPANQHRAMSWMAQRYDASGELYWAAMEELHGGSTPGGLFIAGANGDGTLFYPGTVARIGGTNDIPLESVRLKRIRDGREDYEYMKWLKDRGRTAEVDAVVRALYPQAYSAAPSKDGSGAGSLLAAREQLIAMIREETAPPPATGRIAFASDRDGDFEIFTMAPDGSKVAQLTSDPAADRFPAWSPDGQKIAWTRGDDVWVMNANGSSPVNLTGDVAGAATKPAWSANGSSIFYVSTACCGATDLSVMDANGTNKRGFVTYATGGISSYDPSVSTKDMVYFTQRGSGGSSGLYRYGFGFPFARVTSEVDEVVDVSPDGAKLTFSRSAGGTAPYDVMVSNSDGSGAVNLTASAAGGAGLSDYQSTFSPAADRVAFVSFAGGDSEIWAIGTNATGATPITANASSELDPDWSPVEVEGPVGSRFAAVAPERVLDTRVGIGGPVGAVGPGGVVEVQVAGRGGVAADATAVVLNVTSVAMSGAPSSFLTAWPTGAARPDASNLNYAAGEVVPNLVTVKVGAGGKVSMFNHSGVVHVLADVAGYYAAGAESAFNAVQPARLLDTRTGNGAPVGVVGPGGVVELQVTGRGGVPAGASGVVLNVTAVGLSGSGASYVTAWPTGTAVPNASNLNLVAGQVVPNLVVAKVGAGGRVSLRNDAGSVHLLADVAGYYAESGSVFSPVDPQRLLDTRSGIGAGAVRVPAGGTVELQVTGRGGVAADASAVVLNVTAVDLAGSAASYLTAWPTGEVMPFTSNLNMVAGQVVPNLVMAKVGANGKVSISNNSGNVHVLADIAGYFTRTTA